MNEHYLGNEDFINIYGKVPRFCVDIAIKSEEGILLALRSGEPYKDLWNTPGGTVYKGENVEVAVVRIAKAETGLDIKMGKCLGYIEYLNEERFGVKTHTVSIVLEASVMGGNLKPNENSSELKFFKELPENLVKEQKKFLEKYLNK